MFKAASDKKLKAFTLTELLMMSLTCHTNINPMRVVESRGYYMGNLGDKVDTKAPQKHFFVNGRVPSGRTNAPSLK